MKKHWVALWVSLLICTPAVANDQKVVEDLLKQRLDAVLVVLQNKNLDLDEKKNQISEIVTPIFDFSLMAKLTLGKKHWTAFTQAQQTQFTDLFVKLLKQTYLDRISLYSDEQVIFKGSELSQKKVHVLTDLVSKDSTVSMLYKFYKSGDSWRIYDLEIEGVSLITTYRTQFDEVLRNGTAEDLLLKLEKPQTTS